jgi:hypothetical protein
MNMNRYEVAKGVYRYILDGETYISNSRRKYEQFQEYQVPGYKKSGITMGKSIAAHWRKFHVATHNIQSRG